MGKSSKKSAVKVAKSAIPELPTKQAKKGKRDAEEAIAKEVKLKKRKTELVEVVTKQKDVKKSKASKEPPNIKKPDSSSSDEIAPSSSEEVHGNSFDIGKSSKKLSVKVATSAIPELPTKQAKKGKRDAEEAIAKEVKMKKQKTELMEVVTKQKVVKKSKASKEPPTIKKPDSSSSDELASSGSEEVKDAPSLTATGKHTAPNSEKKGPKTPASVNSQSSGSKTLFVGNLSYNADKDEVAEFFKDAGEIVDVRLSTAADGSLKGFAHVEFATVEAVQKALKMNNQQLFGRPVRLNIAQEKRGSYTPHEGKDNSSYQKDGKGESHAIFIRGFDKSLGEDEIRSSLEEHFGSCGEIARVSIPEDRKTNAPKGIAYVFFNNKDSSDKALELNGSNLGGYTLKVEPARPKGENRSGGIGGGRGGNRDSGGRSGGRGRGGRGRGQKS